jgi:hypothetical protein
VRPIQSDSGFQQLHAGRHFSTGEGNKKYKRLSGANFKANWERSWPKLRAIFRAASANSTNKEHRDNCFGIEECAKSGRSELNLLRGPTVSVQIKFHDILRDRVVPSHFWPANDSTISSNAPKYHGKLHATYRGNSQQKLCHFADYLA